MNELKENAQWCKVARIIKEKYGIASRSGKQCRERWNNHLDPKTRKREWTEDEEKIIFNYQEQYGNQWSEISKFLIGRSDNTIKNHFYATIRRKIRKYNRLNALKITKPLNIVMNDKDLMKKLRDLPEKGKQAIDSEP
jgi:myb proto-oncogene protein